MARDDGGSGGGLPSSYSDGDGDRPHRKVRPFPFPGRRRPRRSDDENDDDDGRSSTSARAAAGSRPSHHHRGERILLLAASLEPRQQQQKQHQQHSQGRVPRPDGGEEGVGATDIHVNVVDDKLDGALPTRQQQPDQQQPHHGRPPSPPTRRESVRQNDPARFYASLVAGAASGALASVLCAPLDLVRVRMQVWGQVVGEGGGNGNSGGGAATTKGGAGGAKAIKAKAVVPVRQLLREIKQLEGYRGFFKGLGATLLTVPVFWAIYFPCYDELKSYWLARCRNDIDEQGNLAYSINPSIIHMMSAVQAGAIADVVCNPMFVVRTRLQTEALHDLAYRRQWVDAAHHAPAEAPSSRPPRTLSIYTTVRNLYHEGGVRGFWRGMTANLLGLAHVAIQFPLYEHLKLSLKGDKRHESAADLLMASSASKIAASFVSYPHEVIRSRMMDSRRSRPATFTDTCKTIYRGEGFRGFYAGLPVSVLRVIPNTCVTFVTYELFLRWTKQQLLPR